MARKRRPPAKGARQRLIECKFLVPIVEDSSRRPHPARRWHALANELFRLCGGFTGPEGPVPGQYRSKSGKRVVDMSRRYTVSIPRARLPFLDELVRRVANTFDQESIYFVVGVEARLVFADPADGYLEES